MKYILCNFLIICNLSAFAQQVTQHAGIPHKINNTADSLHQPKNLKVIARSYGDSVVLRWGPLKATLWYFANKSGYLIIRYNVENNKIIIGTRKMLTSSPVKPWTLEEWKKGSDHNDSLAAVCAQLLYGKSSVMSPSGKKNQGINLSEAMNENYELKTQHGIALFLADLSPRLANGLGLRYTDKNIEKGKTYAYAVFALTDPKIVKSDTSGIFINTAEVIAVPEMPDVSVEELDRKVKFTWNRVLSDMYFTSYYYERSDDGGKNFYRRNRHPYIQPATEQKVSLTSTIELNDSLPQNYKLYFYRIIGITPFGDLGKPTANLPVIGRDKTPPSAPDHVSARNTKGKNVRITWSKKNKEPDFTGFLIGRSDKASGPFIPLNLQPVPVFIHEFIDTSAYAHGTNYYIVSAIDTAGNAAASVPAYVIMTDTIPPDKPVGLTGNIDTSGIVHLKWKLGREQDLMGYLVYSANDLKHTFVPVSKQFVTDSTFSDSITLKTLTKTIYYKVVAFDKNRNPSKYSDPLELEKPLKVAAVTPVFTKFFVTDTSVTLYWLTGNSNDVTYQMLFRRERRKDWEPYAKLGISDQVFIDHEVKEKTWYEYCLETIGHAGISSPKSFPVNVRVYDSGKRPEIQNFKIIKGKDGKSLVLSWNYQGEGRYWFVIYKSVNGNDFITCKNLPSDQHTYSDINLIKANYQYSIKAFYKDGGESTAKHSDIVEFDPRVK
jgi:hypothetical protein